MRIPALIFCTLAAFIGRELPRTAAAAPEARTNDSQSDPVNANTSAEAIDQAITHTAIAPPETIDLPLAVPTEQMEQFDNDAFAADPMGRSLSDAHPASPTATNNANGTQPYFDNHQFAHTEFAHTESVPLTSPASSHAGTNVASQTSAHVVEGGDRFNHPVENSPASLAPSEENRSIPHSYPETKALAATQAGTQSLAISIPEWSSSGSEAEAAEPTVAISSPAITEHPSPSMDAQEEQSEFARNIAQQPAVLLSQIETVPPPIYIPGPVEQDTIKNPNNNAPPPPRRGRVSPAPTIANPSGFGAHDNTVFVGASYQSHTRFANNDEDDGTMLIGVGLGNAQENVGVQLSYTLASFGSSRDFGAGGFNAKVHRQLPGGWGVALGWEGFLTTGDTDFEDTVYGSVTHLIRSRERIDQPFSRIALTAGAGTGRFRSEDAVDDDRSEVGAFGSLAVRIVESVGAVVEWTGQDLAAGVSVAPFKDVPIIFTPALRDITGAGDGARFVFGTGVVFKF
ncbi:MAG: hypothetical protein F6K09_10845 [Merismopedia sp. SIO2A8]|nr:hypothetical protein [Symploca sp. SIO2B6]NET49200.1 hypothetical protein [Merismopedia sp. SIO2A8]